MITRVKPRKLFTALDFEKYKEGRKEGREGRRKEGRKEGNKGGGGHGVWVLRSEREAEVPLGIMNNPVFLAEEVEIFPVGNR